VSNVTSYLDFLSHVKADRVQQVTFSPKAIEYIVTTDLGLEVFKTSAEGDQAALIELLQEQGVSYHTVEPAAAVTTAGEPLAFDSTQPHFTRYSVSHCLVISERRWRW
jgi:hypothetical protein